MDIATERYGTTLLATPPGDIDNRTAADFLRSITPHIDSTDTRVILDMSHVAFMTSSGLRVVLILARNLGQQNATLSMCTLQEEARNVLEMSGFEEAVPIFDTRADALAGSSGA